MSFDVPNVRSQSSKASASIPITQYGVNLVKFQWRSNSQARESYLRETDGQERSKEAS
jgi:hypothetical protein